MSTGRTNRPNIQHTLCSTEIPFDSRRTRISGRLVGVCDTVFIPELGYNGTIIDIKGRYIVVLPHDYGTSFRRLPSKLRVGIGISSHQRRWLDRINVAFVDNCVLSKGTYPKRGNQLFRSVFHSFLMKQNLTNAHAHTSSGRRPVHSLLYR